MSTIESPELEINNEFDVNALLLPALRQYKHNDCSGFVAAYDYAETQKIALNLLKDIKKLLEISNSCLEISKDTLQIIKLEDAAK